MTGAAPEPGAAGGAPPRVLLAKPGLDGHNRGIKVIARALREAGFEVIYTGIRRTPEEIARAAIDEDVDALGLSSLSGAHLPHFLKVAEIVRSAGERRMVLFCGGIIPAEDRAVLEGAGYEAVFGPGTPLAEIVRFVRDAVERRRTVDRGTA